MVIITSPSFLLHFGGFLPAQCIAFSLLLRRMYHSGGKHGYPEDTRGEGGMSGGNAVQRMIIVTLYAYSLVQ